MALSLIPTVIGGLEVAPLEIVFQEESYSCLNSGQSLAWDHFCGVIANPCDVITDLCGIITIPAPIGSRTIIYVAIGDQGVKTYFREINISEKMPEFVIYIGNLSICDVNDEILKNVINIHCNSQYSGWPGEPSNTFGTLELLIPISKKDRSCFVPIYKKDSSCYVPKSIVLVSFQFPKNDHSCYVPKSIVLVLF